MNEDRKQIEGEELDKVSGGYIPVDPPHPPTHPGGGVHTPIEPHQPASPVG